MDSNPLEYILSCVTRVANEQLSSILAIQLIALAIASNPHYRANQDVQDSDSIARKALRLLTEKSFK
jgi:hypothetical protein